MGCGHRELVHLADPLGAYLARLPVHLLVGGGAGVMTSVARAFRENARDEALVIGILPSLETGEAGVPEGYPNPWVDVPIRTHLGARGRLGATLGSRNHINVLTADAVIALPGGAGTRTEIELSLHYERPTIVLHGEDGPLPELLAAVEQTPSLTRIAEFLHDAGLEA